MLHSFGGKGDGVLPRAGLTDLNGTLYGTTENGGNGACGSTSCGTVFSITTSGIETVLHNFAGGTDGAAPFDDLLDVNGTLYGTTEGGGTSNAGTVFSIKPSGKEAVLYSFKGGKTDGAHPWAGLTNVNGTLYGTTVNGGATADGTVFSITLSGKEAVSTALPATKTANTRMRISSTTRARYTGRPHMGESTTMERSSR